MFRSAAPVRARRRGSRSRSSATRARPSSTRHGRVPAARADSARPGEGGDRGRPAEGFGLNCYVDDELYVAEVTLNARAYADFQSIPITEVGDLLDWLERPPTKLVVVDEPDDLDALRPRLVARFDGRLFIAKSLPLLPRAREPADLEGERARVPRRAPRVHGGADGRVRRRRERRRAARVGRLRRRGRERQRRREGDRRLDLPRRRGGGRRAVDRGVPRLPRVIDLKAARADPDGFRAALARKGAAEAFDALLEADERWRALVPSVDELRGKTKLKGKPTPEQLEELQQVKEELKAAEEQLAAAEAERDELALRVPNPPARRCPTARARRTRRAPPRRRAAGARRAARAHRGRPLRHGAGREDLRLALRLLDRRHGAARARALPPRARAPRREGLRRRPAARARAGGGAHRHRLVPATSRTSTSSPADDLYLAGTAEIPLGGLHSGELLDADALPLRYVGFSPCFRREAGAAGRDTRGMVRVHQFNKVEQFSFTRPEDSWDEHEFLLANTEEIVRDLDLPYRVVVLPAGDISTARRRRTTSRSGSRARTATARRPRSRTRRTSRRGGSGPATAASAAPSRCTR